MLETAMAVEVEVNRRWRGLDLQERDGDGVRG